MKQTSRGLAPSLNTGHSTFTGARQRLAVALVAIVIAFAGAQTAWAQTPCNVTFDISGKGTVKLQWEETWLEVTNGRTIPCLIPSVNDLIITPETGYYVSSVTYDATDGLSIDLIKNDDFHWYLIINPYGGSETPTITVHIVFNKVGGADEASAVALTADDDFHLAGGWYKVESDLALGHTVNLHGDTHIIIATGKTLTVSTSDEYGIYGSALTVSGEGTLNVSASWTAISVDNYTQTGCAVTLSGSAYGLNAENNVSISGGSLTTSRASYGIYTDKGSITISGGTVSSSGDSAGLFATSAMNITGGTVSASGNNDGIRGYSVSITGGQVTASSGGIRSIFGDITLGWTSATDYITASGFTVKEGKHVKIADGQTLYGGGFPSASFYGTVGDPSALNGMMLRPTAAVTESGTNEYTIRYADGWDAFCDALQDNDTYNRFSGKTVRLGDDITVTRMAGSSKHDFCGTFDGGGNTLTVNISSDDITDGSTQYVAPFRFVSNTKADPSDEADSPAAFRNLHVTGTITTDKQFTGGLIGGCWGTVSIDNCAVSTAITSTISGDGTHGGIVGIQQSGALTITGCLFDGSLLGATTYAVGGFLGYRKSGAEIRNSLFAPAEVTVMNTSGATFARNKVDTYNSYYTYYLCDGTNYAPYDPADADHPDKYNNGHATRTVAAAADVTIEAVALTGTATQYTVSGITAYSGGGLQRGETLYYGSGDQLSLTLSNSATGAPRGYQYGYTASAGTLSGSTLTMPDQDVTISVNTAALAPIDWATVNQGNSADPYMIYNKDQLLLLAHRVNGTNGETADEYEGKYFKLGADITFSHDAVEGDDYAENYEAIGGYIGGTMRYFKGKFDGDGHIVSGIRIRKDGSGSADIYQGLFGCISSGADIHDVHLTDARIKGCESVGGIAGSNTEGYISGCSVTDSYITATRNFYGTICGRNDYPNRLTNNYYHGCTVNSTPVTSGKGCEGADIAANNGALPAYRLDLGANITTPPGTFAGQTGWLDTPPVSPRLAPENGFTLAGNHYFASGYVFTPGSTLASGAAQGYTPRATLGGQLLDLYTPTGDADPLAGKSIARLTITADCDGKTLAAALRSTGQPVNVAYINADGTAGEASAIALDGTEINLNSYGWYFVGLPTVAFDHTLYLIGDVHLILADGCTMNVTTSDYEGILVDGSLTIYGQNDGTGTLNATSDGFGITTDSGTITISGGRVTATSNVGIHTNSGYITISGGRVTATGPCGGILSNSGTITLGWSKPTDRITASSYSGTVQVADGKKLHNGSDYLGGTLGDPATAVNGKTLRPAATATYTTADGTAATADAILLDASDNSLPAGNYLATGILNYTHGITLAGDVTLILADNCHMNVGTSGEGRFNGYGIVSSYDSNTDTMYDLTITSEANGSGNGNGALSVYTTGDYMRGITANTLTINGGNVTADTDGTGASALSVDKDVTINGGTVNARTAGTGYTAFAIYASEDFNYNGGNVTATAPNTYAISADGNYTFSWRTPADRITIGATGLYAPDDKTATFARLFTDASGNIYTGTLTGDDLSTLAGKHLYPYIETLDLAARQAPDQNYWTTFYCGHTDYEIDTDENACAYTATYGGSQLTLHNLGKEIPKNTAVIIVADNDVVSMTAATSALTPVAPADNDLRGVDTDSNVADILADLGNGTLYVLGMTTVDNEQHFGFHRYTGEEMAAHKAFLHVPGSSNARALDMVFANEETGIGSIESGELRMENFYTLDGRKLNGKPTKPGLYINNGRKVVIK